MWTALQNGWTPPLEVTREFYYEIKQNQDKYPPELISFVSIGCSFGGKKWGGWAHNNEGRNYATISARSLLRQVNKLANVQFVYGNYYDLIIPDSSIIYCDPPYANTTRYASIKSFNHDEFWEWCRVKTKEGHEVFISEFSAPDDFECLIEIPTKATLNKNVNDGQYTERLFKLKV